VFKVIGVVIAGLFAVLGLYVVSWAVTDGTYNSLFESQREASTQARVLVAGLGGVLLMPAALVGGFRLRRNQVARKARAQAIIMANPDLVPAATLTQREKQIIAAAERRASDPTKRPPEQARDAAQRRRESLKKMKSREF